MDQNNLFSKLSENTWTQWQDVPDVLDQVSPFTININNTDPSDTRFNKLLGVIRSEDGNHYNIVYVHVVFKALQAEGGISTVKLRTNYPYGSGESMTLTSQVGAGLTVSSDQPSVSHEGENDVKYYYLVDNAVSNPSAYPSYCHNMQWAEAASTSYDPLVTIYTKEISTSSLVYGKLYRQDRVPSLEGDGYDYNDWDNVNWNGNAQSELVEEYEFGLSVKGTASLSLKSSHEGEPMYRGGLYRLDLFYDITATGNNRKHFASLFVWKQYDTRNHLKGTSSSVRPVDTYVNSDNNLWGTDNSDDRYNAFGYVYKHYSSKKYGWDCFDFPVITSDTRTAHQIKATMIEDASLSSKDYLVDTDSPNGEVTKTLYNKLTNVTVYKDDQTGALYPVSFRGILESMAEDPTLIRAFTYDHILYGKQYSELDGSSQPVASDALGARADIKVKNFVLSNSQLHDGASTRVTLDPDYPDAQTVIVNWSSNNVDLFKNTNIPSDIADDSHYANDGFSTSKVRVLFKAAGSSDYTDITGHISDHFDTFSVNSENQWTFAVKPTAPRGTYQITPWYDYTTRLGQYGSGIVFADEEGSVLNDIVSDGEYYHWKVAYQTLTIENLVNKKSYIQAFSINNDTSTPIITEESENNPYPGYESRTVVIPETSAEGSIVYDNAYSLIETADPTNPVKRFTITATRQQTTTSSEVSIRLPYKASIKKWTSAGSPLNPYGTVSLTGWGSEGTVTDRIFTDSITYQADIPYSFYYLVTAEDDAYYTVYTLTLNPEKRNKKVEIQIAAKDDYNGITASINDLINPDDQQDIYGTSQEIYNELLTNYGPLTVTVKELGTEGVDYFYTKWFDYVSDDLFTTYNMKNRPYDISIDLPAQYDYDVYLIATSGSNHVVLRDAPGGGHDGKRLNLTSTDEQSIKLHVVLKRAENPPWGVEYVNTTANPGRFTNNI